MGRLDFHLEFQSELEYVEEALLEETAVRLRELAQGHNDMNAPHRFLSRGRDGNQ